MDIGDDDIEALAPKRVEGGRSVPHDFGNVSVVGERGSKHSQDTWLIVHDENTQGRARRGRSDEGGDHEASFSSRATALGGTPNMS